MDFTTHFIPVTPKASNVCAYCRVRKQKCDRALPRCERCSAKGRDCDYTPYSEQSRHGSHDLDPLVAHYNSCLHADLSPRGTTELLRAIKACTDAPYDATLAAKLADVVGEILDYADVDLAVSLNEFGTCIQQWCPILHEESLLGWSDDLSQQILRPNGPRHPLLWLCLWLVTKQPCQHQHQELHRVLKQSLGILQSRSVLDLEVLQIGLLITVYEIGHGLQTQASQTLASSIALHRMLELDARGRANQILHVLGWLKASLLMLDRMVSISMTSNTLPSIILSGDAISRSIAQSLGAVIPPHPPRAHASSPRKVHIRALASLASSHVLEYNHARQHGLEPDESYDQVDATINSCIKALVDKPEPHTWQHCDAIAAAFCSHILLQASQVQHLRNTLHHSYVFDAPAPEYVKAHLALEYSRRMAWDMVRIAIQKISGPEEMRFLPFAGLCCVLRAGLAVLETNKFVDENVVSEEEVYCFKVIIEWFAARWGIGSVYLMRLQELQLQ